MKFAVPFLLVPITNIYIPYYSDPLLSGLFRIVPASPDNRGSTVLVTPSR